MTASAKDAIQEPESERSSTSLEITQQSVYAPQKCSRWRRADKGVICATEHAEGTSLHPFARADGAVRDSPRLASAWDDESAHQYGRPAAFFHQLQDLNLAEAWSRVAWPALVI